MTLKQKTCDEIKQIIHDRDLVNYTIWQIAPAIVKTKLQTNQSDFMNNFKIF